MVNIVTQEDKTSNNRVEERTTIGLRAATKKRLDRSRAPGQCYDGFIRQLVDCWEKYNPRS